jgi:CheY-specific phosphatase CheX
MPTILKEERLKGIAYQTFEITCYMFPLEEWEIDENETVDLGDDSISAVVRFDGAVKGGMQIRVSPDLFDAIAENMLGLEEGNQELKEGALCEIANIICGNTVPIFAKGEEICYIRTPRIAESQQAAEGEFGSMISEKIHVHLDEGVAEVTIYYSEN